jgi:hypothetical protein
MKGFKLVPRAAVKSQKIVDSLMHCLRKVPLSSHIGDLQSSAASCLAAFVTTAIYCADGDVARQASRTGVHMVDDINKALAGRDYAATHGWAPRCLSEEATRTLKEAGKEDVSKSLKVAYADLATHREDFVEYGDPDRLTAQQQAKLNCRLLKLALLHRADCLMLATGLMFDSKNLYGLALIVSRAH